LEDRDGLLNINTIRGFSDEKYFSANGRTPSFGTKNTSYWVKFSIVNPADHSVKKIGFSAKTVGEGICV
jgi:hypothetical protein